MHLVIDPREAVRAVFDEAIDLATLGPLAIARASHVEPDQQGHWLADLCPSAARCSGPFGRRSEALQAEQGWLEAHWPATLA